MENKHPHANFAASIFGNLQYARGILKPLLPPEVSKNINWKTLKRTDSSFVDEKLKDFHSDLLFTAKNTKGDNMQLYILFEHKSHPDYGVLQQLLAYQKEVYAKQKKYTPIIPVVFYHGKEKWNVRTEFATPPEDLAKYALNFAYILIDLRKINLEEAKISLTIQAILYIFNNIWDVDKQDALRRYIEIIAELFSDENSDRLLRLILMYIFRVHDVEPAEVKKVIESVTPKKGDIAMTTAERLEKRGMEFGLSQGIQRGLQRGLQRGRQEGRQEGQYQAKLESAKNLQKMGFDSNVISSATGLSKAELKKIGVK